MTPMTTTQPSHDTRPRLTAAVAAGVAALALMMVGTFVDTPWKNAGHGTWGFSSSPGLADLGIVMGFAGVGAAAVFGAAVVPGLRRAPEASARRSLVLAVLAAVSIAVFWTGLPVILAAGAALLALDARTRLRRTSVPTAAALALAALASLSAVALAFTG
jgi:hypothetical protein